MSERPTFAEGYARATQSGNLKHRERGTGDTDRLAAMAWADRELASHLYRARVTNDAQAVRTLKTLWAEHCVREAARRRWTLRVPVTIECAVIEADMVLPPFLARRISALALEHWLIPVCRTCNGTKFRRISEVLVGAPTEGVDALTELPCPNCKGTGGEPLRVKTKELRPLVERCVKTLQEIYDDAAVAARGKLGV